MKKSVIALFAISMCAMAAGAQKMTPETIVAKNLDSIAAADVRAALKNITFAGDLAFAQGPTDNAPAGGRGVMASEGNKLLLAMTFPIPIYPVEKISNDGSKVKVGFTRPGVRSALGEFLYSCPEIIREGVLGGTLTRGWGLADYSTRGAKLSFDGTKKVDGRELYAVSYSPKKGANVKIRMYFETDTFRHVKTEYSRTMSAQMGATPELSSSQTENHETLTEEFSDFKTENGITLPRTYKFRMYVEKGKATREYFYTFTIKDIYLNQTLDPNSFNIDGN